MDLFTVEPETPRWITLKEKHGIYVTYKPDDDLVRAHYSDFYEEGETEREAVVAILHTCKLEGWETVSVEP